MNVHIVLAHPEPDSFNARLSREAAEMMMVQGHEVSVTDLYGDGFDPAEGPQHYTSRARPDFFEVQREQRCGHAAGNLDPFIQQELERLERCDLLVLQYPVWWFGPPAIMKGWIDRVLVYGATYDSRNRFDNGLLKGRSAMLSVTFGGAESTCAYNGRNGDVALLLWPTMMSLFYVGFTVLPPFTAFGIGDDAALREQRAEQYRRHLSDLHAKSPIPFNVTADWDDEGRLKLEAPSHSLFIRKQP